MVPLEVSLERLLHEKHSRKESEYKFITGRLAVENLPHDHIYPWLVSWANRQLWDIGINSSAGRPLPQIHFDIVQVLDDVINAHVFQADSLAFIVVTEPMIKEMCRLSHLFVERHRALMKLQIAPNATTDGSARFLLFMQFCIVVTHEYSHLVRHWQDDQAIDVRHLLSQAQELDADGYGVYHTLTYFFDGEGRSFASQWLKISSDKALENSILDCYLLSVMLQFCAQWAGKTWIVSDRSAEHPPQPVRIEFSILMAEMWLREVHKVATPWMTDGTLNSYFKAVESLFPLDARSSWTPQMSWLRGPESEAYRTAVRRSFDQIRTGKA